MRVTHRLTPTPTRSRHGYTQAAPWPRRTCHRRLCTIPAAQGTGSGTLKISRSNGVSTTNGISTSNQPVGSDSTGTAPYDVIVVGSGNGACAFLSQYMEARHHDKSLRVAVVEEGAPFFETSSMTHQAKWTETYSQADIYRLHDAVTPDNRPIMSGRACTQGGGGSINYTMIHETDEWLSENISNTTDWKKLKRELNSKFHRPDPQRHETPLTKRVVAANRSLGYKDAKSNVLNIVNFKEPGSNGEDSKLYHVFTTQFDRAGMRTNSGASLVDWDDPRLTVMTRTKVLNLDIPEAGSAEAARCSGLVVQDVSDPLRTGAKQRLELSEQGVVVMCAGATNPILLHEYRDKLGGGYIGKYAMDHILLPVGVYRLDRSKLQVTRRDFYLPVFTTFFVKAPAGPEKETAVCIDYYAGELDSLLYFVSHLYLSLLLPNPIKLQVIRRPRLFMRLKQLLVWVVTTGVGLSNWLFPHEPFTLVTATVKFNQSEAGYYASEPKGRFVLPMFQESDNGVNVDAEVAKAALKLNLEVMKEVGEPIPKWIASLVNFFIKLPFEESEVDKYVEYYKDNILLTQQHMAGGCLFGQAIEVGDKDPSASGRLKGTSNVYVADLSGVPLPRVSPQMTAYLVGHYVATQLTGKDKEPGLGGVAGVAARLLGRG